MTLDKTHRLRLDFYFICRNIKNVTRHIFTWIVIRPSFIYFRQKINFKSALRCHFTQCRFENILKYKMLCREDKKWNINVIIKLSKKHVIGTNKSRIVSTFWTRIQFFSIFWIHLHWWRFCELMGLKISGLKMYSIIIERFL